ncbi:hypothetical protein SBRCBS47491_003726 [Sporothrix bragantina]|uniref:Zn(2)-C6 fungal-type domain-containing protein n=1 Tax=Sporothrix bragantina TaxID=671064 RepID=A0ABP0BHU9_9PEZI
MCIKCDEARPSCQRCTQKGLQCGGYQQGVRWAAKHQLHLPSHHSRAPGPVPAPAPDATAAPSSSAVHPTHYSPSQSKPIPIGHPSSSDFPFTSSSSSNRTPSQLITTTASPPTAGIIDSSSAFIVHWFENVCPAWSGFDSNANPIRTIAVDVWRSSVTVCSALEAMSAAFLASRDPTVRQPALRLMRRAADYAQVELGMMRMGAHPAENNGQLALPTGLLFSLFGLGTTVCWVDAGSLGLPFLRETRRLLVRLNRQQRVRPGAVDAERLEFFNKCMTYCNMLLSVVHDDVVIDSSSNTLIPVVPETAGPGFFPSLPPALPFSSLSATSAVPSTTSATGAPERRPHPWTGISSLASRLFAETMGLCRRAQLRSGTTATTQLPTLYLRAERLEEQLLDAEIEVPIVLDPDTPGNLRSLGDTGDSRTPPSHLALIAEAYRLSSLLVLYETFPGLGVLRLPGRGDSTLGDDGSNRNNNAATSSSPTVLWQEWITPLSLHLLQVLERIPPTSGSRVIQPLLYICASTGLRQPDPRQAMAEEDSTDERESIKVSQGRNFIIQRLTILESSLPPTPVTVAKKLVCAIWRAYDVSLPGTAPVHWINVMEANNLRSMFG